MSAPLNLGMQQINTVKNSTGAPELLAAPTDVARQAADVVSNDWGGIQHLFTGIAPNSQPLSMPTEAVGPNGGQAPLNVNRYVPNNVGTFFGTLRAKLGL